MAFQGFGRAPVAPALEPYSSFKDHCAGTNNNTGLVVLEAIRACHPDNDITPFSDKDFDVLGWAAATGAEVVLFRTAERSFVKRTYQAPPNRISEMQGRLTDHVVFGQYRLQWKHDTYDFYTAEWPYSMLGATTKLFYLLLPRAGSNNLATTTATIPAVDALLLDIGRWTARLHDEIWVFDSGEWVKEARLWTAIKSCDWDDIVLDPGMKQTLSGDVHNFFDNREIYRNYSVPWKRGIILHGSPGCGKTMSIKAIMNSLDKRRDDVACLVVRRLESSCIDPQDGIRLIFGHARAMAPCVLVIEDLDSLVTSDARSYFLNEVDGLENNDGILIIGSTNHLDRLDTGISKRPSRFDRKYHFKLPDLKLRALYCEMWRAKLKDNKNVNFDPAITDMVARMTEGLSFAYLKELLVQSLLAMARRHANDTATDEDEDAYGATQSAGGHESGERGPDVPQHLRQNPLVWVLREQIVLLKRETTSTEED